MLVNGNHIGRFWNKGATQSLYIPKGFLNEGANEVVIFETEGIYSDKISFTKAPIFDLVETTLH